MDAAFFDDPTVQYYHADMPDIFAIEHHRYVQLCAEPALDHGGVHATAGYEGAAIWYPPGISVSDADYEAFKSTLRFPDRLEKLGELAELCDAHRPLVPHWTLELVAVDPAAQGKGVGGALMSYGLAKCDRLQMPAFLGSSNPMNLPFYKRLGFVQVAEVQLPGIPAMYPMIRQPLVG